MPYMVGCYISLHRACGGHTVSISRVLLFSGTDQYKTGVSSWLKVRPHNSNGGWAKGGQPDKSQLNFPRKGQKGAEFWNSFVALTFPWSMHWKTGLLKDLDTDICWKNWCRFDEPREKKIYKGGGQIYRGYMPAQCSVLYFRFSFFLQHRALLSIGWEISWDVSCSPYC